ncbi:MAG: ribonuclease Y [Defluviitaleaceae bacterium]|nr:ribonuclease Y [Defluviitaleaceae bacterium]
MGILLGAFLRKRTAEKKIGSAELEAINIIKKATESGETRKKELLLEAKEESIKIKNEYEKENRERKNELSKAEKRLIQREESLDKKFNSIENRENQLQKKNDELDLQKQNLEEAENKQIKLLEQISGFSQEQAKEYLLETVKEDVRIETAVIIKDATARAKAEADKKVLDILSGAIQRCAVDHVSESTVSVVHLPSDEMKGRIIGREGRNIRTLESLTGIDLIIDDTPEAVILSGFDAVRREIARLTLEKLILDGRIHPARIEEMVEKSKKEVETLIKEEGESAIFEIGIRSIHPELIKLLGKMKFRTSYGQNVLKHSIEVAHLSGLIASELGVDVTLAKRAGLLHDIGKSVDQDMEGTHVQIGANLCKKYRENDIIINAVESHHGDVEPTNIISVIVQIADAISAARPGARRETLETYIKRLEKLEAIADAYKGVEKSFAIQAGRELRVLIIPEEVDDAAMTILARDISKSIESELEYPGQIKVSLIRETRAIEYAK